MEGEEHAQLYSSDLPNFVTSAPLASITVDTLNSLNENGDIWVQIVEIWEQQHPCEIYLSERAKGHENWERFKEKFGLEDCRHEKHCKHPEYHKIATTRKIIIYEKRQSSSVLSYLFVGAAVLVLVAALLLFRFAPSQTQNEKTDPRPLDTFWPLPEDIDQQIKNQCNNPQPPELFLSLLRTHRGKRPLSVTFLSTAFGDDRSAIECIVNVLSKSIFPNTLHFSPGWSAEDTKLHVGNALNKTPNSLFFIDLDIIPRDNLLMLASLLDDENPHIIFNENPPLKAVANEAMFVLVLNSSDCLSSPISHAIDSKLTSLQYPPRVIHRISKIFIVF